MCMCAVPDARFGMQNMFAIRAIHEMALMASIADEFYRFYSRRISRTNNRSTSDEPPHQMTLCIRNHSNQNGINMCCCYCSLPLLVAVAVSETCHLAFLFCLFILARTVFCCGEYAVLNLPTLQTMSNTIDAMGFFSSIFHFTAHCCGCLCCRC